MSTEVGNMHYDLDLDLKKFQENADKASEGFKGLGEKMTKTGKDMSLKVTAPIVGLGALAIDQSIRYDTAMDTIQMGTGATGDALKGLMDDFNAVVKTVPEGADVVSKALADVNTRFGVNGEALQNVTKEYLDFARITETDVSSVIRNVSRFMGDWSIDIKDNTKVMGLLTKVSQDTGASIDQLTNDSVTYGVQLRTLGFTHEETIALLGKFEKEGVATSKVFSGLSVAMANLSESGAKDLPAAFQSSMDAIKNAKTDSEATSLAMELFGRRAGPDLAIAVREGRFEIDEYVKSLGGAEQVFKTTVQDTVGFEESLMMLGNELSVVLAPLGQVILSVGQDLLPIMKIAVEKLVELATWFSNLDPNIQKIIVVVFALIAAIGPFLIVLGSIFGAIGNIIGAVSMVVGVFGKMGMIIGIVKTGVGLLGGAIAFLMSPLGLVILAIVALIAVGVLLYQNWDKVKEIGGKALSWLSNKWTEFTSWIGKKAKEIGEFLQNLNPFHRNSPSLVDNVKKGMGIIRGEFENISGVNIPPVSALYTPADTGYASTATTASVRIDVGSINNMGDLDLVSRELAFKLSLQR